MIIFCEASGCKLVSHVKVRREKKKQKKMGKFKENQKQVWELFLASYSPHIGYYPLKRKIFAIRFPYTQ